MLKPAEPGRPYDNPFGSLHETDRKAGTGPENQFLPPPQCPVVRCQGQIRPAVTPHLWANPEKKTTFAKDTFHLFADFGVLATRLPLGILINEGALAPPGTLPFSTVPVQTALKYSFVIALPDAGPQPIRRSALTRSPEGASFASFVKKLLTLLVLCVLSALLMLICF